ncbi:MAG TPA: hypothetical protein VGB46_02385 [Flavisolibacter sp.]
MKTGISAILLLIAIFFSCRDKTRKADFYSYTKKWDLWRVPILEPFEIVSPTNSGDWFLIIRQPGFTHKDYFNPAGKYEFQLTFIDSVGVADSVLVFKSRSHYWPRLSGDYKTTLIIKANTNEQFIYSDVHHQREIGQKLKGLGVENVQLYSFEKVKQDFQAKQILPKGWRG